MEFERVAAAIEAGGAAPAYVLHGPERLPQRLVLTALRRRLGLAELGEVTFDGARTSGAEIAAALAAPSLFGGRLVLVEEWPLDPVEPLLAYLDHPAPDAALVVRCAALDRRRRLCKRLLEVGVAVDCRPPRPAEAVAWLRRRGLSPRVADLLAARVPPSFDLLDRELEKLSAYGAADEAAVVALVPPAREERVFDLLDAVAERRAERAAELAARLLDQGEEPLGLLALLAHQVRLVLRAGALARRGLPPGEIAGRTGAHPFAVRRALEQARRFGPDELAAGLEAIWAAEWSVKAGRRDEAAALELALLSLVRAVRTDARGQAEGAAGGQALRDSGG
jgi:DNA polymerase-3 subunit delta